MKEAKFRISSTKIDGTFELFNLEGVQALEVQPPPTEELQNRVVVNGEYVLGIWQDADREITFLPVNGGETNERPSVWIKGLTDNARDADLEIIVATTSDEVYLVHFPHSFDDDSFDANGTDL